MKTEKLVKYRITSLIKNENKFFIDGHDFYVRDTQEIIDEIERIKKEKKGLVMPPAVCMIVPMAIINGELEMIPYWELKQ